MFIKLLFSTPTNSLSPPPPSTIFIIVVNGMLRTLFGFDEQSQKREGWHLVAIV